MAQIFPLAMNTPRSVFAEENPSEKDILSAPIASQKDLLKAVEGHIRESSLPPHTWLRLRKAERFALLKKMHGPHLPCIELARSPLMEYPKWVAFCAEMFPEYGQAQEFAAAFSSPMALCLFLKKRGFLLKINELFKKKAFPEDYAFWGAELDELLYFLGGKARPDSPFIPTSKRDVIKKNMELLQGRIQRLLCEQEQEQEHEHEQEIV